MQSFHNGRWLRLTTAHDLRAFGSTVEFEILQATRRGGGQIWADTAQLASVSRWLSGL